MSRSHTFRDASTPRRSLRCLGFLAAGLLLIAATAIGCGESDADKAQTQVCDARADMQKQIDELAGLTASTATANGVEENLSAIGEDLNQIEDARGDLSEDRKQEVESATRQFTSELETIAGDLGSDLTPSGAKAQLETAGKQLASSYEQTFAQIDCE